MRPDAPLFGLALSGGGIRSATFSLGVLQGLAQLGLLRRVDYLSTVSGGGYIGSFLGGLFCPRGDHPEPPLAAAVEAGLKPGAPADHPIQRSLHWLRENGRYLTPGGSGDFYLATATVLRNWVSVMAVAALALFTLFVLSDVLTGWARPLVDLQVFAVPWFGKIVLSYWFVVGLAVFGSAGVVLGWAYWLVGQASKTGLPVRIDRPAPWVLAMSLVATALAASRLFHWIPFLDRAWGLWLSLALFGCYGLLTSGLYAAFWIRKVPAMECRRRLSRGLRGVLIAVLVLFVFGLLDSLTWTAYLGERGFDTAHRWIQRDGWPQEIWPRISHALFSKEGIVLTTLSVLAVFRQKLEQAMGAAKAGKALWSALRWALRGLLVAAALALGLGLAVAIGSLAHSATTLGGSDFTSMDNARWLFLPVLDPAKAWLWALVAAAACAAVARTPALLNLTTLEPFYTAALTRAYLGASNRDRTDGDSGPDRRPKDDLSMAEYQPWLRGGPLHILNTTLNVTTGGASQVLQRDRKGSGLAVGPAGISIGPLQHARRLRTGELVGLGGPAPPAFVPERTAPEPLSLGQWVGISGAAVSTGMGARTSLATSLLCGFLNLRLGHWWWSGQPSPAKGPGGTRRLLEALFPVQVHLGEEWTAHFPGTSSRYWYLSDGGHFENTGAYELLRRRLPLILLCDNGQDPGSCLGDLANLVAKARIDLGAEIRFFTQQQLNDLLGETEPQRKAFGDLDQLLLPEHQACAALAEVRYAETPDPGFLLVLKPTRTPDLPMDLRDYARTHEEFPQQSTADQFFDERQWESYRKLGEFIAVQSLMDKDGRIIPWLRDKLGAATSSHP